jgi:hypothetical protein
VYVWSIIAQAIEIRTLCCFYITRVGLFLADHPFSRPTMVAKKAGAVHGAPIALEKGREITPTIEHNGANLVKANKRAKQIFKDHLLYKDPVRLDVNSVGPSPLNRGGLDVNVRYVHNDVCANIDSDGYDPARPQPGIVIRRTTADGLKRLLAHTTQMRQGSDAWPPMITNILTNECLAGNHLTTGFQLFKCQKKDPFTGRVWKCVDDEDLELILTEGFQYFVLKDDVSDADAEFISSWRNADQNQNQQNSEASLAKNVQTVMIKMDEEAGKPGQKEIPLAQIIGKVSEQSLVRLKPDSIASCARLVSTLGMRGYVDEWLQFHTEMVNPKEMQMTTGWMGDLAKLVSPKFPLTKLSAIKCHLTGDQKQEQTRPLPDLAREIGTTDLANLGNDKKKLDYIEGVLRNLREKGERYLVDKVGARPTRQLYDVIDVNLIRLALSKGVMTKPLQNFRAVTYGKWSEEKAKALEIEWVVFVQRSSASMADFPSIVGVDVTKHADGDGGGELCEVPRALASHESIRFAGILDTRDYATYDMCMTRYINTMHRAPSGPIKTTHRATSG